MKVFVKEFKEFIMRGNVIDMAVGVIIGGAFNNIVSSLVNDMLIALDGNSYPSLKAAQDAAAPVIAYGNFIQIVVQFLLTAFVIFLVIKGINKLHKPAPEPAPTTKTCPFCKSEIHIDAVKCPHCASDLNE